MGISFSTNRRRQNNRRHLLLHHHHHPPPPYYYLDPPPPPPPQPFQPHYDYNYSTYHIQPPPPPQINTCSYGHPYHYYPQHPQYLTTAQPNWWGPTMRPGFVCPQTPMQPLPPPYVENQNAKKVRNDVNVHRDTLRLQVDESVPAHHLVSFVFDAIFHGSFTITFFAEEEPNCTFVPQFPEVYPPTRFSFQKGPGQRFLQPSGTGTDLSFFALDDLSKPLEEDVYPLVISAETVISPSSSVHKQVTQAVLERDSDGSFQVKVMKQILWIEGVRYELRELYGSTTQGASSG
ncbi:putative E3 ubiquitin-protein ligase LUL4 [Raphanus sativus]|nr:putative E3 ubiquitin-protein ligase LUL4 [Raphanus sativus]